MTAVSFNLDLKIKVMNGKICTDLYDKRDTFSSSVNVPHNTPSKPAYGVVISVI